MRLARAGHRHRAGKTVLAIQLVLDLAAAALIVADSEEPDIAGRGATGRRPLLVPVRLSPPAFDSMPGEEDRNGVAAEVGSARLDAWLVGHLVSVYGVPEKQAAALVAEGWILPVLDGLDEMDPDDQALPRRAASLIRALNCPTLGGLRPVVVTCRTGRYRELSTIRDVPGGPADGSGGLPGGAGSVAAEPAGAVQDATAVEVEPLTVPA